MSESVAPSRPGVRLSIHADERVIGYDVGIERENGTP